MFGIGLPEMILILALALIVVGTGKASGSGPLNRKRYHGTQKNSRRVEKKLCG